MSDLGGSRDRTGGLGRGERRRKTVTEAIKLMGYVVDVTERVDLPKMVESLGESEYLEEHAQVYETHLFLDPHSSPRTELWFLSCRIVPGDMVDGPTWEKIQKWEMLLEADTPKRQDAVKNIGGFVIRVGLVDGPEEGEDYEEWYVRTMETEVEAAHYNDLPTELVARYDQWIIREAGRRGR